MVMFLPKDFPRAVSPDYAAYSFWQFLHSVSGTVTGTLSTQALLHALGLGAAASAGLAATTNWIIKDGFGLLGGVLFAGSIAKGFDNQPKRFRFLSAALIQISTFLELLTPLFPTLFVPIASVSNIGKNIGWLSSSASRASIHRGFSLTDNLGDVTAKAGAQGTMAGLLGTVSGIGISYFIGYSDPFTLLYIFFPLSVFNMYCCYQSNHVVITRTLNVERGDIAIGGVVNEISAKVIQARQNNNLPSSSKLWTDEVDALVLPLLDVSKKESFVFRYKSGSGLDVLLEPSLVNHLTPIEPSRLKNLFEGQSEEYRMLLSVKDDPFIVRKLKSIVGSTSTTTATTKNWRICLWFLESSKPMDHFKAFYHACLARQVFLDRLKTLSHKESETSAKEDGLDEFHVIQNEFRKAVQETSAIADETFPLLITAMVRRGWHVEFNHFGDRDARIRFQ
ncbi:vitamin B6 photo-protection and homoeostasis-domain-containing protein [Obelidium mucronatum]|nr:vitamin B6 photo-protection and homoeostasis-domain-containing protein [Obelidium mucronatum]